MGRITDSLLNEKEPNEEQEIVPESTVAKVDRKKGRPSAWIPHVLQPAELKISEDLETRYGASTSERFGDQYAEFCKVNNLEVANVSSLIKCIGQAHCHTGQKGLALSSLDTYVTALVDSKRFPIRQAWKAVTLVRSAHADATDVQPRTFKGDRVTLEAIVEQLPDFSATVAWLAFITGHRVANIVGLRFSQILLEKSEVRIQWRLTKTARIRSKRKEVVYLYSRAMPPPKVVKTFLAKPDSEAFINEMQGAKWSTKRAAGTLTNYLKKEKPGTITSYVFRDCMQATLEEEGLSGDEIRRLMDHTQEVAEASYSSGKIHLTQIKRVNKTKEAASAKRIASKKKGMNAKKAAMGEKRTKTRLAKKKSSK